MPSRWGTRSFPRAPMSNATWSASSASRARSDFWRAIAAHENAGQCPAFSCLPWPSAALALGQDILELGAHAAQGLLGGAPVDAGIGDGHAVLQVVQVLRNGLAAP